MSGTFCWRPSWPRERRSQGLGGLSWGQLDSFMHDVTIGEKGNPYRSPAMLCTSAIAGGVGVVGGGVAVAVGVGGGGVDVGGGGVGVGVGGGGVDVGGGGVGVAVGVGGGGVEVGVWGGGVGVEGGHESDQFEVSPDSKPSSKIRSPKNRDSV